MQDIDALKFRNKSKGIEDIKFKSNESGSSLARVKLLDANNHFGVADNHDQGEKMKEKLANKRKRIEDSELKSNGGDPALSESNEGDCNLVKINIGDASEHAIAIEVDDQGNKKKKTNKKKSKKDERVSFSDQLEVFNDGLVQGKWYTPEDEKIKESVYSYVESHGLGDKGPDMILACSSHSEIIKLLEGNWISFMS